MAKKTSQESKSDMNKRFQIALRYQKERKYAQAEKEYSNILKESSSHQESLLNLSVIQILQKKYNDAEKQLKAILKQEPEHGDALYNLAIVYQIQENYKESAVCLGKLVELTSASVPAVLRLYADSLYHLNEYEKCSDILDEYLQMRPRDGECLLQFCSCQMELERYPTAVLCLRSLLEEEPDNESALRMLVDCHQRQGAWDKCASVLKRLVVLKKEDPHVLHELCKCYEILNQTDELKKCERSLYYLEIKGLKVAEPDEKSEGKVIFQSLPSSGGAAFQDSVLAITEHYSMNDDWRGALRELANLARKNPSSTILMQEIAYIYQCTGEVKRAAGYYEKILSTEHDNLEAMLQLIRIAMELGDYRYGIRWSESALELYEDVMEVHEIVGLFFSAFQQYDRALTHFEICEKEKYQSCGVMTGKVQCLIGTGKYKEAVKLADKALKIWPESVELARSLVKGYIALGSFQDASAVLKNVCTRFVGNIGLLYLNAQVAVHGGNFRKAGELWKEIARLKPGSREESVPYIKSLLFTRRADAAMTQLKQHARYRFKNFDLLYLESMVYLLKRNPFRFGIPWQELWVTYSDELLARCSEIRSLLTDEDIDFMIQCQPETNRLLANRPLLAEKVKSFFQDLTSYRALELVK
jgi:tetratricopeptide (TPR) repeat protein